MKNILDAEPEWLYAEDMTAEEYYKRAMHGLHFIITISLHPKTAKPWVIDWMKKNEYTKEQISAVKNVTDSWIPMSVCSYARALTKGMPVNHSDVSNYMKTLPGVGIR